MSTTDLDTGEVLDHLLTEGYAVVERDLDASTTADLHERQRAGCVSPDRGGARYCRHRWARRRVPSPG